MIIAGLAVMMDAEDEGVDAPRALLRPEDALAFLAGDELEQDKRRNLHLENLCPIQSECEGKLQQKAAFLISESTRLVQRDDEAKSLAEDVGLHDMALYGLEN